MAVNLRRKGNLPVVGGLQNPRLSQMTVSKRLKVFPPVAAPQVHWITSCIPMRGTAQAVERALTQSQTIVPPTVARSAVTGVLATGRNMIPPTGCNTVPVSVPILRLSVGVVRVMTSVNAKLRSGVLKRILNRSTAMDSGTILSLNPRTLWLNFIRSVRGHT